ncbi:MAG: 4a-hydroxytetrahydrobiopterin dehydratase [Chromatiaceae bacterium]|nr:4a-hydroxytetrahydrobiopterin dehydratase [Chromatiaceae bacterium]
MRDAVVYTEVEAGDKLAAVLPSWQVEGGHLRRRYVTDGWRASMLLANGIAHLAELAWHHPDLQISWGSVLVSLRTHSADAISDKDFELAGMIEHWVGWRPASDSTLDGAPSDGKWRYLVRE